MPVHRALLRNTAGALNRALLCRKSTSGSVMTEIRAPNTAPRLTPPGAAQAAPGLGGSRRFPWWWLAAGLLVAAALAVVLVLPALVEREFADSGGSELSEAPQKVRKPSSAAKQLVAQRAKRIQHKQSAESLLEQVLRRAAELESSGVAEWASGELAEIQQRIALADLALEEGRFEQAAAGYRELLQSFDALDASRPKRLTEALEAGRQALQQADGELARQQFLAALALQPDNAAASLGLRRSKNIARVVELTRQGQSHAERSEWAQALAAYQQAQALDPEHQPAQQGIDQARVQLSKLQFEAEMSDALSALAAEDYAAADRALHRARELRPDDAALADAERRLTAGRKSRRLRQLSAAAEQARSAEDWLRAERLYQQALQLEPGALSAQSGLRLATERIALQRNIDRYLQHPERLQADEVLANAKALLTQVEGVDRPGPQLSTRRDRLRKLVAEAGQQIPVLIRSDGLTEVAIYRVGRFGRFLQQRVMLRPGAYTLVGSREGFRDVRITLQLKPGSEKDVRVICEEPI